MKALKIHPKKLNGQAADELINLCPFSAIVYENGRLVINQSCKMCMLCVKNGPDGAVTLEEASSPALEKAAWSGVAVYGELRDGRIHPVVKELLGKARELAGGSPVYVLLIGRGLDGPCRQALRYGADKVYAYDYHELARFDLELYANAFSDFIEKVKPSSVLVGATNGGRSLAPKVAARFRTGITADCTALEMRDNTDLVQIRPAFGGNIMAQIVTPNHRPQLCTVRHKVFPEPLPIENPAEIIKRMVIPPEKLRSPITILSVREKAREIDLSEAKTVVAVGRGAASKAGLELAGELADILGAQLACTRPLIGSGPFDAKRQIGLSGRTVNADLIITLGVSGSVQFAAGMKGSKCIIAVDRDEHAGIFDIAHYGFVGDIGEVVPDLITRLREAKANV